MKLYLRSYQIEIIRLISAKWDFTYNEAILILFKSLKDEHLRTELKKILSLIHNKDTTIKSINLTETEGGSILRKLAKANGKPTAYIVDMLLYAIKNDNPQIFFNNIKYLSIL